MPTDPVTDTRDQITDNALGGLAEGLLDKQGNLTFEIKRTSPVARDQYGNPPAGAASVRRPAHPSPGQPGVGSTPTVPMMSG